MFGLFKKDPIKQLTKEYEKKLEEAMQQQRKGDLKEYARLTSEAEHIMQQIESKRA